MFTGWSVLAFFCTQNEAVAPMKSPNYMVINVISSCTRNQIKARDLHFGPMKEKCHASSVALFFLLMGSCPIRYYTLMVTLAISLNLTTVKQKS